MCRGRRLKKKHVNRKTKPMHVVSEFNNQRLKRVAGLDS